MHKFKSKFCKISLILLTFFINCKIGYADGLDCSKIPRTVEFIKEILGLVKIAIPILIILLGSIDFVKAIIAKNDEQIKKAQSAFVTRLIIGVVIFFVPLILKFILRLAGLSDSCLEQLLSF